MIYAQQYARDQPFEVALDWFKKKSARETTLKGMSRKCTLGSQLIPSQTRSLDNLITHPTYTCRNYGRLATPGWNVCDIFFFCTGTTVRDSHDEEVENKEMSKKSSSSCIDCYERMINWVAQKKEFSMVNRRMSCFSSTLHSSRRLRMVEI